jgi:hypothetical protein
VDEDDLEEVSEEERREAEALARALESRHEPERGSLAELAARVRGSKAAPAVLDPEVRRRAVEGAIAAGRARRRRRTVVAVFAAAAVALVAIGIGASRGQEEPLRYGGPASAAFAAPFDEGQPSTDRMDRLARARSRDYFAAIAERAGGRR